MHRNDCCKMQLAIAKTSACIPGACLGIGCGPPGCCRPAATARCPPLLQHSNSCTRSMQSAWPQVAKNGNTHRGGPQLPLSTAFKPRHPHPAIRMVNQPPPRQSYSTAGLCRKRDVPILRQPRTHLCTAMGSGRAPLSLGCHWRFCRGDPGGPRNSSVNNSGGRRACRTAVLRNEVT